MAGGRPSIYTDEIATEITLRLSEGESLAKICRDEGMPGKATVWRWLREREAFRADYTRAREEQAEHYASEIADIADDPDLEPNDKRVRIDARKWIAGKLKPLLYGDRQMHEHTGAGGAPIQHQVSVTYVDSVAGGVPIPPASAS